MLLLEVAEQYAAAAGRAGAARWRAGAERHAATGLRGQVSSATSPFEQRILFSRTPCGVLTVHTSTLAGWDVVRYFIMIQAGNF